VLKVCCNYIFSPALRHEHVTIGIEPDVGRQGWEDYYQITIPLLSKSGGIGRLSLPVSAFARLGHLSPHDQVSKRLPRGFVVTLREYRQAGDSSYNPTSHIPETKLARLKKSSINSQVTQRSSRWPTSIA
jgi:hypothetical protein